MTYTTQLLFEFVVDRLNSISSLEDFPTWEQALKRSITSSDAVGKSAAVRE